MKPCGQSMCGRFPSWNEPDAAIASLQSLVAILRRLSATSSVYTSTILSCRVKSGTVFTNLMRELLNRTTEKKGLERNVESLSTQPFSHPKADLKSS